MNELTVEWVRKAESDYRIMMLASKAENPSEPDAVIIASLLRTFIRSKLGLDQPATPKGT